MKFIPAILAFALMFANVPVSIALIMGSFFYFSFVSDTLPLTMIIQKLVSANMSPNLLAIPFFIMIGSVMNYCGITKRLLHFCDALVGHKVGGFAQVNVLLSTLNGGICGSGAADAAMQCKILVPEMEKKGYGKAFCAAVTAASGLISPVIPPGNLMILYAVMVECSVSRMFVAGYMPGILMCVIEMGIVSVISHRRHYAPSREKRASLLEVLQTLWQSIWAILIAMVLIVGVRMGFFNITEGAVVVIVMCIVIGKFVYKELEWNQLPMIFIESFRSSATIMLMIIGALCFGQYLSWARIPQDLAASLVTVSNSPMMFMVLAMLLVLFFGMLLDGTALMMIMTPLLWPIAKIYGIDVYAFGIMMILNASIGSLTPPVGGLMYICCNITKVEIPDFTREAMPFIIGLGILLVAFVLFPQIITFLPTLVYA
jgi:tripartite ATP-independent transporter DctM subunit